MTYHLQYRQHGQPHWQTVNEDDDETPRVFVTKFATSRFVIERGYPDFEYRAVKAAKQPNPTTSAKDGAMQWRRRCRNENAGEPGPSSRVTRSQSKAWRFK